ncbi:recombinase family protein [Streptomyces sp. SYSU K21746]
MTKTLMASLDVLGCVQQPRLRAVTYLRVSTEEQKNGYGIASQDRKTKAWIERKGHEHVETFKDEGASGSLEMGSRPEFDRLMALAITEPRAFDLVAVPASDRIGRTDRAFWRWVWALEDIGVYVALVNKDIDNTTDAGRDAMREEANYAFEEYTRIRTRTQEGIQEKAEEGKHAGGVAPYGWRIAEKGKKGESHLVLDVCNGASQCKAVHEATVMRRAWTLLVIDGKNCRQAARIMNAEGLRTRSGKLWTAQNLRRKLKSRAVQEAEVIFRNPETAGKSNGTKVKPDGTPQYGPTVVNELPPLFDDVEVAHLNKALARNARTRTPAADLPAHPLSKRVFGKCGAYYTGLNRTDRSGRIYRCSGKVEAYPGAAVCSCSQVDADAVEERVWTEVCRLMEDPARLTSMSQDWLEMTIGQVVNHADRITELDRQIEAQDGAIASLMVMAAEQGSAPEAITRATNTLKGERDQLVRLRKEAAAWQAETEVAQQRAQDLQALADTARTRLHDMTPAEQAEVLDLLDVKVTLQGEVPKKVRADDSLTAWFRSRNRGVPVLTDASWAAVEPTIVATVKRDRTAQLSHRQALEAMLEKARSGSAWNALGKFGNPSSLIVRYQRWVKSGLWDQLMDLLADGESTPLPPAPYPLPPLLVEGRVDPRLLVGVGQAPADTASPLGAPSVDGGPTLR